MQMKRIQFKLIWVKEQVTGSCNGGQRWGRLQGWMVQGSQAPGSVLPIPRCFSAHLRSLHLQTHAVLLPPKSRSPALLEDPENGACPPKVRPLSQ